MPLCARNSAPRAGHRCRASADARRIPRALFRARDACCLVSVCTEYVGVVARALGRDFVTLPRMLPVLLAPMLEKLGDTSNEARDHEVCTRPAACKLTATWSPTQVAVAGAAALLSAAAHCGYDGSLHSLVTAHSDYIIDALCRQLRHLEVQALA